MSSKGHHNGKNHSGQHTTITDLSEKLIRVIVKAFGEDVRISPGIIKQTSPSRGGERIKVSVECWGLLITARGNTSIQELRVYVDCKDGGRQTAKK